jgi:DNA-binding transcriptional MerR regulator
MTELTIGQVAERTGFSTSALRYYEELGLVTPTTRTGAGYRLYDDDALLRLAFIARAKRLGCTLDEITDLLGVWDGERCGPVQLRFHTLVTDKLRATQHQIADLLAFASQLQVAAARLDGPPIDGMCDSDCACFAEDAPTEASVTLSPLTNESGAPIACTLQADAMPERMAHWQALLTHVHRRRTTPDGRLRLEFDDDVDFVELARLVAAEQQCCNFFAFALTVDARGIAVEVNAPDEVPELVGALFGIASQ